MRASCVNMLRIAGIFFKPPGGGGGGWVAILLLVVSSFVADTESSVALCPCWLFSVSRSFAQ